MDAGSAGGDPDCEGGGDTWWIGVAGTIFGCFVSNFGTNIQKVSLDRNSALAENRQRSSLRQPLWLAGCFCMIMGAIADFAALPFAPQSLLAPLATTTLVFNVAMANYLSKERPTCVNILATVTILGGTVLVVVFGDRCSPTYQSDELVERFKAPWMLIYMVVVGVFLTVGATLSVKYDRAAEARRVAMPQRKSVAFVMAAVGGVFGGNTILCAKSVGELISTSIAGDAGGIFNWSTPVFVVALVANLLLQVRFLNEAIRRFAMLMVIPVYQTFWILSGTLSGLIYFEEYEKIAEDWKKVVGFFLGTCMALGGIFVLTSDHAEHEVKRASEAERRSLIINDDEDDDEAETASPGVNVASPVIVRPAGMRQSIGEFTAYMERGGAAQTGGQHIREASWSITQQDGVGGLKEGLLPGSE